MTSYSMSSKTKRSSFCCPACHASQLLQDVCRRCAADLRLVVAAHRRVAYLVSQRSLAEAEGDVATALAISAELELLAPRMN